MNQPESIDVTTATSTALLDGLRQSDAESVWSEFVDRYRPLIVRYAGRLGLATEDAEDAAQQTLTVFAQAYHQGKYDRAKGRLRHWLYGIARNQIRNWRRRQPNRFVQIDSPSGKTDFFAGLADENELESVWDEEWRDAVLRECLAQVRREVQPATYEAFDLFALQGQAAQCVAEKLGITSNAVFGAKRRILKRIRELHETMEDLR